MIMAINLILCFMEKEIASFGVELEIDDGGKIYDNAKEDFRVSE